MSSAPEQVRIPSIGRLAAPLVAIVGPTASGKSSLAVHLARRFGGEILACDSTQVFRHFDIGTGKPTSEERSGIPHHLLDLLEPGELFTAGAYRVRAQEVLADLRERSCVPILTVGTGLYLRGLLEGLADTPARSEELRARLEAQADKLSAQYLHRVLRRLDATSAARIGPGDRPKMIRAIEVCLLSGRPLTEVQNAGRTRLEGYAAIKIGLQPPRAALYQRIETRVHTMLGRGWLTEVAGLIRAGIPPDSKPFGFIGYRELRAHLEGTVTLATATKNIAQATRRYAKRQLTWFRKEPQVHWLAGFGDDPATVEAAAKFVGQHFPESAAGRGGPGH